MDDLKQALASLQPPIEHSLEMHGRVMHVSLTDPAINVTVTRVIECWQYQSNDLFHVIILHAIHELQSKGSHAPLKKLPLVGGRLMEARDFES
jgi:hypothetical protein